MPAFTMRYRSILSNALDTNTIRFVTAASFGHRVSIPITIGDLTDIFMWTREIGESVPTATVDAAGFAALLTGWLTAAFTDKDPNAEGLNLSSSVLDTLEGLNANVRKPVTEGGVTTRPTSSNDLVMAYLLFRCFGKTNYADIGDIYNLEDAHDMITDTTVTTMFSTALASAEGNIQATNMLRDQLANDPSRYITGSTAVAGLFNTGSTDVSGEGQMVFLAGDVIEFPIRLVFTAPVSVASISDDTQFASGSGQGVGTTDRQIIEGEVDWDGSTTPTRSNVLSIRLQLTVT